MSVNVRAGTIASARLVGALALVLAWGPWSAGAAGAAESDEAAAATSQDAVPAQAAGVQVFVDKHGRLRQPTPAEVRKLAEELGALVNTSVEGLSSERRADGTLAVDLEGRLMSIAVATREPDGRIALACLNGAEEAAAWLLAPEAEAGGASGDAGSSRQQEVLDEY